MIQHKLITRTGLWMKLNTMKIVLKIDSKSKSHRNLIFIRFKLLILKHNKYHNFLLPTSLWYNLYLKEFNPSISYLIRFSFFVKVHNVPSNLWWIGSKYFCPLQFLLYKFQRIIIQCVSMRNWIYIYHSVITSLKTSFSCDPPTNTLCSLSLKCNKSIICLTKMGILSIWRISTYKGNVKCINKTR